MGLFAFMHAGVFTLWERAALWSVLGMAVVGLGYAAFLAAEVLRQDTGTDEMRRISRAIRVGAMPTCIANSAPSGRSSFS